MLISRIGTSSCPASAMLFAQRTDFAEKRGPAIASASAQRKLRRIVAPLVLHSKVSPSGSPATLASIILIFFVIAANYREPIA